MRESTARFPTRRCVVAVWNYQGFVGGHLSEVEVGASRHSVGESTGALWMGGARALSPRRIRWHGRSARLLRIPPHGCSEWGDVMLYVPPNAAGLSYDMTLQAWKPVGEAVATIKALAAAA